MGASLKAAPVRSVAASAKAAVTKAALGDSLVCRAPTLSRTNALMVNERSS